MSPSAFKDSFADYWAPQVGARAARHQMRAQRLIAGFGFGVCAAILLGIAIGIPTRSVLPCYILLVVPGVLLIRAYLELRRAAREMSKHFGFKVRALTGPTFTDKGFDAWNRRHGLSDTPDT
jgi:Flp pilus assembly protein TadB